jgi:hypothetical protein
MTGMREENLYEERPHSIEKRSLAAVDDLKSALFARESSFLNETFTAGRFRLIFGWGILTAP